MREISWSNNIIIMEKCKDDLQREFYIQMTKRYGWTKRILTNFIEAQTYKKYLLNQTNFDLTLPVEQRVQAKLAVKDEYTFDFAELSPEYSEHELEMQLVNNIRAFLIEMGGDYTFIENQYHLMAGNRDLLNTILMQAPHSSTFSFWGHPCLMYFTGFRTLLRRAALTAPKI